MRFFRPGAAIVAAALITVGCGSDDNTANSLPDLPRLPNRVCIKWNLGDDGPRCAQYRETTDVADDAQAAMDLLLEAYDVAGSSAEKFGELVERARARWKNAGGTFPGDITIDTPFDLPRPSNVDAGAWGRARQALRAILAVL